jgi:hypothetical protein
LNNNIKKHLFDDITERVGALDAKIVGWRARKELSVDYIPNGGNSNNTSNNSSGSKDDDDNGEFTRFDKEEIWHQELSKHGFSYESLCNPANSDRVWILYEKWCRGREEQEQQKQKLQQMHTN